jgi:hypothetical protein
MLDKTEAFASTDFTAAELEIFAVARAASTALRRTTFENWVKVGRAVVLARQARRRCRWPHKARRARAKAILAEQGLSWVGSGNTRLIQVMGKIEAVEVWRSTLTDVERARWNSPQAVWNKCPAFHADGKTVGPPKIKSKPMLVSELVMLKADDIALLFYRRDASKAWALRRSLDALLDGTPKPKSGWAAARDRAAAGASVAA